MIDFKNTVKNLVPYFLPKLCNYEEGGIIKRFDYV